MLYFIALAMLIGVVATQFLDSVVSTKAGKQKLEYQFFRQ